VYLVHSASSLRLKYGVASKLVLKAVENLGPTLDVSGLGATEIQHRIASLPRGESACLVGGYDCLTPFFRTNPTRDRDNDTVLPTDAPYGATPGVVGEEYSPRRAVGRIPDSAEKDASGFVRVLRSLSDESSTPAGVFEEAANEFSGAAGFVHRCLTGIAGGQLPLLAPPEALSDRETIRRISKSGRIHILLHGAGKSPDWSFFRGRDAADPPGNFPRALSVELLSRCNLSGSIVSFSSCYAGMLDGSKGRTPANQAALACLRGGAKVVVCSTRAVWIQVRSPYDGLGPGLVGRFWKLLLAGRKTAGEALRAAKRGFLRHELARDPANMPYVLKTVLQTHLYGSPDARLRFHVGVAGA
jgi:hypothetical protein